MIMAGIANRAERAGMLLLIVCLTGSSAPAQADTFSATPTFNNVGVEVTLSSAPTNGTQVRMFIRKAADAVAYREIHPLSRTSSTNFSGSAFWLDSGTAYSIRLESTAFASNQFLAVTTRADTFPAPSGTTYHVATNGNDSNNGLSYATALRTLGAALAKTSAGSTVLMYDGRYYEGDLSVPRSGTATQPIVIRNAPGVRPVLDGTDTNFAPSWVLFDGPHAVYRTPLAASPENAYLNGGQLYHYLNLSDLTTNLWNQPGGYYVDSSYMYVRFPGGVAPGSNNAVTIPKWTTGIQIGGMANIQIIGIEFCYYGSTSYHRGIYIDGGDSNLVDQCFFHQVGIGVALKRAACFNTIQNCRFTESPITNWSWHAVKEGGVGYEAGGVAVYSSTEPNVGNVVRYNIFTNMFDGSGIGSDDLSGPTKNLDFHDNVISGCIDDGIEADGVGVNNRIYRNTFDGFLTGISVAPCAIGPTYIFRNTLARWHAVGEYDGYPFKFNVSSPNNIQWVHLYHNTCYTENQMQEGFLFKNYCNWTNIISRNNIYAGTSYALSSWSTVNPVDFDYDDLYTSHGTRFISWAGSSYSTLAAFTAARGQELHGCAFEPKFLNRQAGDYRLHWESPLIDRGQVVPGMNDPYIGTAPDIGAFEFVAAGTSTVAVTGAAIEIRWCTASNGVYQAQYTTNLLQHAWTDLGNVVTSAARNVATTDANPPDPQRMYRLKAKVD
ncbi:MAG: hypothetical protein C0404_06630 [Verrucomicrobia bacterium]|nr:hypothetical protein [Verrucomicrobiota bacterium]